MSASRPVDDCRRLQEQTIRHWWHDIGRQRYPNAQRLAKIIPLRPVLTLQEGNLNGAEQALVLGLV